MNHLHQYINILKKSFNENTFVKLSLSNYKGQIPDLKNCYVKRIQIKQEEKLSVTYRYKTKDIVKNYSHQDGIAVIEDFLTQEEFRNSTIFTIINDTLFEINNTSKTTLKTIKPTYTEIPSLEHNHQKNRIITANNKTYLHLLNITDVNGNVHKNTQDKYKQINRYIELLSPLITQLPKHKQLHVADMGSGKGYLTFALYDYLSTVLNLNAHITGVEYRKDLVDLCNDIAKKSKFEHLKFKEGTIESYNNDVINILIALHACDTATDDAIYKGITANADLIVVAPCCHKQIRREIEKHKTKNELDFLLKHGIFLERQSEMVTDGLRSLILEYFDYSTKVFEFISDAHTPKNVMIVAEKKQKTENQKTEILNKIKETKKYFGIEFHQLEKLMKM